MDIQWYPGHMTKARRAMQEDMKLIDLLIEMVDARVPAASRNPDIDDLGRNRARLIILNKADLASGSGNDAWERWFSARGFKVIRADSRSSSQLKKVNAAISDVCREKTERDRKRGIVSRPVRAMVVGIPNVGKSTFINSFAGRASAKTGNRPGVTKGNQWIRLNRSLELLDTPGLLWPKFDDPQVGLHLALIGSISEQVLNKEELALELIRFLAVQYPENLRDRYGLGEAGAGGTCGMADEDAARDDGGGAFRILEQIARARACLLKGGACDHERAAGLLLDDFRSGRLGRITLEFPPEQDTPAQAPAGRKDRNGTAERGKTGGGT